jgi:hypothetical protein
MRDESAPQFSKSTKQANFELQKDLKLETISGKGTYEIKKKGDDVK